MGSGWNRSHRMSKMKVGDLVNIKFAGRRIGKNIGIVVAVYYNKSQYTGKYSHFCDVKFSNDQPPIYFLQKNLHVCSQASN